MIEEIEREEIYDLLEHIGVKGMHWGVRKARQTTPSPGFKNRSVGQKAAIIGTAALSGLAGAYVTRHTATPIKALGIGSFATAGAQSAALLLDQHGQRKVSAPPSKVNHGVKPPKAKKETRSEKKQRTFAENQKKAEDLFNAGAKNPNDLILLNGRQVVTGREFTEHMINGGLMDINTTKIYARQKTKTGPYILEK